MAKDTPVSAARAVEVRGVEKTFGEMRALRGIDLEVNRGECLVIFGPNGAGKTTLLKILATLMKPSAGRVILDGVNIRERPAEVRRKISLVGNQTFLYDNLTVYENLKFYGRMYDVAGLEERIREVISWVGLESRLHDRAGTLSRGLQQRASFARAVLHDPPVLFLDEPDVGLDPRARAMVGEILKSIGSGYRTVVMATHNLEQGLALGDNVVILDRGRVAYRASRQELGKADFRRIYNESTETGG
ncbi:MAG: ABC transporter ATP-binding protein [Dehalococcoidales bacterium]|nr:ABC transporter ATP-binding protein [Dehalococcoidales bacterium]